MGDRLTLPCPKIGRLQQQLTPDQSACAWRFGQEHVASILSTTAVDEQEVERHLHEAYRVAKLQPPARIRWFDSPLSFMRARAEDSEWVRVGDRVRASVRTRVWYRVRASVWDIMAACVEGSVRLRVGSHVEASVRGSMEVSVRLRLYASLKANVRASVWYRVLNMLFNNVLNDEWAVVRAQVESHVESRKTDSVRDSVQAYSRAHELVFYQFFYKVSQKKDRLIHLARLNEMVSGYYLGRKEAWLVRKPIILERDEAGHLHSASGMCMQYRDGRGFYAWHGVRVSEQIIMRPEQLTREDWMAEHNLEVRRAIQERLGNEQFVELAGGRCIDQGRRGNLIEIYLGDNSYNPDRVVH